MAEEGDGLDGREWYQGNRILGGNQFLHVKSPVLKEKYIEGQGGDWLAKGACCHAWPQTLSLRTPMVEEETKPSPGCHGPSPCMSLHAQMHTHRLLYTHKLTHKIIYKNNNKIIKMKMSSYLQLSLNCFLKYFKYFGRTLLKNWIC